MRIKTIAQFMQMNGAISGWRDGVRWLRLPGRSNSATTTLLSCQSVGQGGLKICSTVTGGAVGYRLRDAHASSGFAR